MESIGEVCHLIRTFPDTKRERISNRLAILNFYVYNRFCNFVCSIEVLNNELYLYRMQGNVTKF